jgi:hypothetical protein
MTANREYFKTIRAKHGQKANEYNRSWRVKKELVEEGYVRFRNKREASCGE